jgi:hypothetical protein
MPKLQQLAIDIAAPYEREKLIRMLHALMLHAPDDQPVRFAFIPSPVRPTITWIIRFNGRE